jgi:hypothetical protein
MSPTNAPTPPTSELFTQRQLAERHAHLLNLNRIVWAVRKRAENGLETAGAVFASPCGEWLIHEPTFLRWFLGLTSRNKPRATRRSRGAAASMHAEAR